jgi:hypothetical protein
VNEPDSWCTIIPLVDLYAALKTPVCFANGLLLTPMPDLLRQDQWTERLSAADRKTLEGLQYAFVAEYEIPRQEGVDPSSEDSRTRLIQKAKHEIAELANFALWLARPSPVCFELIFDAPRRRGGLHVSSIDKQSRILCHPRDRGGLLSDADLDAARDLHCSLCALPKASAVLTAVHASWSALKIEREEVRYLLLWVALEALFVPEDARTPADLLAQRIGHFLSSEPRAASELSKSAFRAYSLKCSIAYGLATERADLVGCIYETESLLRRALRKILLSQDLMKQFSNSTNRTALLSGLVSGR